MHCDWPPGGGTSIDYFGERCHVVEGQIFPLRGDHTHWGMPLDMEAMKEEVAKIQIGSQEEARPVSASH